MDLPARPTAIDELQAASAVGQGKLYRVYDELLRERGVTSAQVLLTFFDMSARTHYLNARQTLAHAARVARGAGDQRERHDRHRRDLLRRQRLPRRAGRACSWRADVLVLLTDIDGLYTADPRLHPDARSSSEVSDFGALEELEIGHTTSPLGSGGMRSKVVAADMATAAGIATVICNGLREGRARGGARGRGREGHPLPAARGALLELQAVAEVRQAGARHARRSTPAPRARVREGSASLLPVGLVEVQRRVRRGRRRRDRSSATAPSGADGPAKGICNYSAHELRA